MLQIVKNLRTLTIVRRGVVNIRWYSDDDSSDDERKRKDKNENAKKNSSDALKRLNSLLESMSTSKSQPIEIVKAKNLRQKAVENKKKAIEQATDLKTVTQKIAQKIGGDTQKTEAELLSVLLGTSTNQQSNLNEIIGGLKVEADRPVSRAQTVRNALKQQQQYDKPRGRRDGSSEDFTHRSRRDGGSGEFAYRKPRERTEKKVIVNLFDATPLNIFDAASLPSSVPDPLETWSRLEKREMKLAVTHPPRNYFEKMILWTDQGKIWKFPIDNEQGMDVEKATDFTEHVMLEMHLEGWCPTRGPIRHFMELVCVGLGKNNFLSAKEKKDHIMWYREYFESKKDLLGELLTLGIDSEGESEQQKQIE